MTTSTKILSYLCLAFLCLFAIQGCESENLGSEIADTAEADAALINANRIPLGAETISSEHADNREKPPTEDPTEALFKLDRVLEISIDIDGDDWDELCAASRTFEDILLADPCPGPPGDIFEYYPAQVTIDGVTINNVGVRKKGFFGSLSDTKPSLKIKFSEYEEDQEFEGMDRLTLNNSQQDPSYMNTCLTYRVFAAANYPSPRCNFAHVTVNGEELGVYVHVESMKKPYLRRHFDNADGNLYEGTLSDFTPDWRGSLQKKTNKAENDWSDVDAAVAAVQMVEIYGVAAIEAVFDVDTFLTFWALEVLVAHWDGYAGNHNNFYVYMDPTRDQFVFLPWGPDATFAPLSNPLEGKDYPASVVANSILAHRLYKDEASQAKYISRLLELLDTVWDEEKLFADIDQMESSIKPYLPKHLLPPLTTKINKIRDFVASQREAILTSIDPEPPVWPHPLGDPPCWDLEGDLHLNFETKWGTAGSETPLEEGSVDFVSYTLDGADREYNTAGVTAGEGINDEGDEEANFSVFLQLDDGSLELLIFVMHPSLVKADSGVPFQEGRAGGYRLHIPPPFMNFEFKSFIAFGGVQFGDVDTTPGGTIRGAVQGRLLGAGGSK